MVESVIILSVFLTLIIAPLLFIAGPKKSPVEEDDTELAEGTHFMKG